MENFENLVSSLILEIKPYKYCNIANDVSGVYSFWFNNSDGELIRLKRDFNIKGTLSELKPVTWDWNLNNEKVCLYVGKSTKIKQRIGKHLLRGTQRLYAGNEDCLNKKTPSCQLRAGFDYLFLDKKDYDFKKEMEKRLEFSYLEMDKDDLVRRFYLEDYLIGKLRPWFNIDSER